MIFDEVTLTDIQDFVVREVAISAEFAALATSLVNKTFVFYRGDDLRIDPATRGDAYFIASKFNAQDSENVDTVFFIQYILGVVDDPDLPDPVADSDGVYILPQTDHVEQLAIKALGIIRQGLSSGGLNGRCDMRISDTNILITEVGEADDVQAIVTLRFESFKTL